MLAITGNVLGGAYTLSGVLFIWVLSPILDVVFGESESPRPPRESGTPFERLLWVHGILHFVMLATFFYFAASEGITRWLLAASLSTGLVAAASAIVTAHELGHQRPKSPGWRLARALLFSINYTHFTTEHNHNHHKNVATDKDPASATYEQSIWSFWIRTIPGQFSSVRYTIEGQNRFQKSIMEGSRPPITVCINSDFLALCRDLLGGAHSNWLANSLRYCYTNPRVCQLHTPLGAKERERREVRRRTRLEYRG